MRTLVQALGKGFGQSIRQGFGHDRIIGIVVLVVFLGKFLGPMSRGDGESADVIDQSTVARRENRPSATCGLPRLFSFCWRSVWKRVNSSCR
jgi:hypothetical protein